MGTFESHRLYIPANKFYPPRFEISQCLVRSNLIGNILARKGPSKQAIVFEAQAGQGKTTLILQFLDRIKKNYAWYQVGAEDSDPVLFLKSLLASLNTAFPEFAAPLFEQIITSGEVSPLDLNRLTNLLLADLDSFLDDDFYVVFDDLHLLQNAVISSNLLNYLVATAPPCIHFILASRRPVKMVGKLNKYSGQVLVLTNSDLAMSESEVSELYNDILLLPVSTEIVHNIHKATEGWAMGIIMAGHDLERRQIDSKGAKEMTGLTIKHGGMLDYFKEEIFLQIPEGLRHPFLQLAFLDEIPVELAQRVTGLAGIAESLRKLMANNYFVRRLDVEGRVFGFHHLFQEFLQERARREMNEGEIKTVLATAAQYCLENNNTASALRYLLKANDLDAMEEILSQSGMDFLVTNQTATLASILQGIPEEIIQSRGWFALFSGMVNVDSQTEQVQPLLEKAGEIFSEQNEGVGELLAISYFIHHYNATYGLSREKNQYLERAVTLFDQFSESLSVYSKIFIATNLATGFGFFASDFTTSNHFSSLAIRLVREHGAVNFEAVVLLVQGYVMMFSSQQQQCLAKVEQAESILYLPQTGTFNMMTLRFMQINYLVQYGSDALNYYHQKAILIDLVGNEIIKQSIAGLHFFIFEMDIALGRGQVDTVLELADQGLASDSRLLSGHTKSKFLDYQTFAMALKGRRKEALAIANESHKLRIMAGVPVFTVRNKRFVAAVYGLCGEYTRAVDFLTESIQAAKNLPNIHELAGAYLYRAYFHLHAGENNAGCTDLKKGLQLLREYQYDHFHGWTPSIMEPLLLVAVKENIEADYAKHLAVERLNVVILDKDQVIPVLQVKTLGGLRMMIHDKTVITSEEFTPAQREFMALLVASPNLKLSQEKIQVALWPDSSPEKARKSFDTLLSRCRKILSDAIQPGIAKKYLNLQKGILCLENCRVDAHSFIAEIKKGMEHARLGEIWQMSNAFNRASNLWQGSFIPSVVGSEDVRTYRDTILMRFVDMSLKWGEVLSQSRRQKEALGVISRALQYDRTNSLLVRQLYLLQSENTIAQAQQVLKDYEQALLKEEYEQEEIEELLDDIRSF